MLPRALIYVRASLGIQIQWLWRGDLSAPVAALSAPVGLCALHSISTSDAIDRATMGVMRGQHRITHVVGFLLSEGHSC